MYRFFKNLPLSLKLTLIGLIPLLFLLFLSMQVYNQQTEKLNILNSYLQRTNQSVHIATLLNELQSERRYSFGYVVKKDWRTELVLQRPKTDAALKALENDPDNRLDNLTNYTFLDSLPAIRNQIDKSSVTAMEVMNYYTNTIFRLNTLNTISSGNIIYLKDVSKDLVGQKLLSEMVTYLGILRSQIYYLLYTNQTSPQAIDQLKGIYDLFRTYQTEFSLKASPNVVQAFNELKNEAELKATLDYTAQLFQTKSFGTAYDSESWWNVSASGVDQIKGLQSQLLDNVRTGISTVLNKETKAKNNILVVLIVMLVFVLLLISYTIKSITDSLRELNRAAQKITVGDTGLHFDIASKDVIGELAQSMLKIDETNKVLSHAANAIGSGHFDITVQPRSKEDILGNAVAKMKDNLQQFTHAREREIWIQTGITHVADSLRGDKDLTALCADSLTALLEYTGGSLGLFYVSEPNAQLRYTAGYAVSDISNVPKIIRFGETLIGQAALKKEVFQLQDVPDDYIKVQSASGEAKPAQIFIVPLIHNNKVKGVMEIASLQPFTDGTKALINQVAPNISVALQTTKSRMQLQELLAQTQQQAEELQTQHEEMEHLNAELEAHTQRIQASEEELRVQQEELQQTNQELEERTRMLEEKNQLVIERNHDIQKKAEELAQSTKYKSEFLANMSHELRTPLNSILLLSRLMSENNDKNLTPDQVEYANVIQSSGKGLLLLIDEILDLSKIEAGKMELEYTTVSVQEVVHDMQVLFEPVAKEKKVLFETIVADDIPLYIQTDKLRLEQILRNLLSNALKFTSQGSVTLHISAAANHTALRFSVKDTGIGIAKEKQQSIFEAFQQADGSTRRKYGGTGLGLSISRELTRLLGGEIKLTSEVAKGSEFEITIPVQKTERLPKENPVKENTLNTVPEKKEENENTIAPSETISPINPYTTTVIPSNIPDDRNTVQPGDKCILIVEDDTSFAKALLDFTRNKGYKGIVSVRGDEGIELAKQYKPTGILLDIQLPVKNGWQVMDDLKNDPQTRHIPVHIMSSHQVKKESLLKGAVDFINKPVAFEQMQEVFKKIETVLNRHPKKVLIVEENAKHAQALSYYLESFRVNNEIKSTVADSIETLQKKEIDCVILDMGVPDKKAYDTLETIKKNPGLENLPIIIFTGKSLSKAEEQHIRQYADSIVVKTAHSYQRIMDEVSLFLHLMDEHGGNGKAKGRQRTLGSLNEVLNNKTVLVADDDVRNIFSLTKTLELMKMNVITAIDGKEALQQLAKSPNIDIVLMDMMMPEMDGYETIKTIRKNNQWRTLPIIAVTAKAMTGDREKCIQAGASDYITKPVDMDQLLSLLRVWLYEK